MERNNILFTIAIDNYKSEVWDNLQNAVSDTKEISKILIEKYFFELHSDSLLNGQATKEYIYNSFNTLSSVVAPEDNLIILFAGHGHMNPLTNRGYWVPHDGTQNPTTLIENSVIKDFIQDIKAKHIWLIADSCFSGTFLTRTRSLLGEMTYYKLDQLPSRWMLASGGEEKVSDGQAGAHSPFSKYLIRFLQENRNIYTCVSEIIKYVSQVTANNSIQTPRGASIDNVGHEDGEMVLTLQENFIVYRYERSRGTPNTPLLRKELSAIQKEKHKLAAGKEILLIKSFIDGCDYLILENFRFNEEGHKKIQFEEDKIYIKNIDKVDAFILIQRFATWQGVSRFLDRYQDIYDASNIRTIRADSAIEEVEKELNSISHAAYMQELLDFNKDPMTCLHCDEKISSNDSYFVEIDEVGLKENIGNVHVECLRQADRIIGQSGYENLTESNLINFNFTKWLDLLVRGQGQLKAIRNQLKEAKVPIINWNSENIFNEGEYCIKVHYEDGSTSFMKLGKDIHRFKKEEIDREVERFNLNVKNKDSNPMGIITETKMAGPVTTLRKIKESSQTIVCATQYEKAKYSKQFEQNTNDIDNDYTPLGIVIYAGSSDILKIDNFIPIISNPIEFDKYYENWITLGINHSKCILKIISSDIELDSILNSFFSEKLKPVIDPIFNPKTRELITGYLIDSMENIIQKAIRKEDNRSIGWMAGDKVKVVFPDVKTDKHATGVLLSDEFIDENGISCIIFQPIENGKPLVELQYKMPTHLLVRI